MVAITESDKKSFAFVFGLILAGAGVWLAQKNLAVPGIISLLVGAFLISKALE